MTRQLETQLLQFCVAQHGRFEASAWLQSSELPRACVAAVARFLAGTRWYGHQAEMDAIARTLTDRPLTALWQEVGFEPGRFAGLLRAHLRHAAGGGAV